MKALESLFGQSPFAPLKEHMQQVYHCVEATKQLIENLPQPLEWIEQKATEISDLEHLADLTKTQIKKNLSKSLFLSVNRDMLIQALSFQDGLADTCERIVHALSYHTLNLPSEEFKSAFQSYCKSNFETVEHAKVLVEEYDAMECSSFGGSEAERVDFLVEQIAIEQHQCKLKEHCLMKLLYANSPNMPYAEFHLWHGVIRHIGKMAFQSEKLVYRIRRMMEKHS